jgi:uncharacterized circularly permuted ATP-grasp superfamily protein
MTVQEMLSNYIKGNTWDEMMDNNSIRVPYQRLFEALAGLSEEQIAQKNTEASELFMNQGITFTVYSDKEGIERIFPFDIIPRIITSKEWEQIEQGIKQRLKALNLFLKDIYQEYLLG